MILVNKFFKRKRVINAGFKIEDYTEKQLLELDKALNLYPHPILTTDKILRHLRFSPDNLLDSLTRRVEYENLPKEEKTLPLHIDRYTHFFGKDIYENIIHPYFSNMVSEGWTNGRNKVEIFMDYGVFKKKGITYDNLTDKQKERMQILLDEYPNLKKDIYEYRNTISYFIEYDLTNYLGRIRRLKKLGPAAGSDLLTSVLRYGKKNGVRFAQSLSKNKQKGFPNTKYYWLNKGFSEKDSIAKAREHNKNLAITKDDPRVQGMITLTIDRWLDVGLSYNEAKESYDLICRYFKNNHILKLDLHILKTGHTLESYVYNKICSVEDGKEYIEKYREKIAGSSSASANELFKMIAEKIGEDGLYFETLNHEYNVYSKKVDFYDSKSKLALEYFGDYWHRNPTMYDEDHFSSRLYAYDIWQMDRERLNLISNHPDISEIHIVWEKEFKEDKEEIVDMISEYILTKRKFLIGEQNGNT